MSDWDYCPECDCASCRRYQEDDNYGSTARPDGLPTASPSSYEFMLKQMYPAQRALVLAEQTRPLLRFLK